MKTSMIRLFSRILAIGLIFLFLGCEEPPEPEVITFTKTYGGSNRDIGVYVQQTFDGGYIIIGTKGIIETMLPIETTGDVWLIKVDANGIEEWSSTFGRGSSDRGASVQQSADGGYIIGGSTWSSGGREYDAWLIKTNTAGDSVWSYISGGSRHDGICSVKQTFDGGFIITGYTESFGAGLRDVWMIKTEANGREEWSRTIGGNTWDEGTSIQQTTDGGYVIAGYTYSFGNGGGDFWIIKTGPEGQEEWSRTFGGSEWDGGQSIQQTADGGYIITGCTWSFGTGEGDVWLIKTDANGVEQWSQTYGGSEWDGGEAVQQTSDGGYIVVGYTWSFDAGEGDVWLIKTNASGDEEWSRTFGDKSYDWGSSVQQTNDGGYVIAGETRSVNTGTVDVWLIKTDAEGNVK